MKSERQQIRQHIQRLRKALTQQQQNQLSRNMSQSLLRTPLFYTCNSIGAYFPHKGEIDPTQLVAKACSMGKSVYLPVIRPKPQISLWFARYRTNQALFRNSYGIPEPAPLPDHLISVWALDLVLVPLVAFDKNGNRLGMGGGYYDRTFAYLRRRSYWKSPKLIGLAYEFQKVNQLQTEKWDIPLHGIITDKQFYR